MIDVGTGVDRIVMLVYRDGSKFPESHVVEQDLIDANSELASRLMYQEAEVKRAYNEGYRHGQMSIEIAQDELDDRIRRNWFGEP